MDFVPITLTEKPAWKVNASVIWALYIRETKTRFGKYKLGLLWAIIESLAMVAIKTVIFGLFLQITIPQIPYSIFLMAGYVPFRLFSGIISHGLNAINSNEGLLIYPQLKPLDPLLARMLLELLVFFISMGIFLILASWFGAIPDFEQPLLILSAILSLIMLAAGMAIYLGMMAHKYRELEKIVPLVIQPLVFVSCVLFPLSSVPSSYQAYLVWNPLVVIFEGIRKGLYADYPTPELSLLYPFSLGIISLSLGLSYYYRNQGQHYMGSRR